MRHMSFFLTTPQILARSKTVTRRIGWAFLKPGDLIQAVEKGQGLRKGEKVRKLAVLRVVSVRTEALIQMADDDLAREGFPGMTRSQFFEMFCRSHNGCNYGTRLQRIEFEYVGDSA